MADVLQLVCDSSSIGRRGGGCLSEDQVLEFIEGLLPDESMRGIGQHLDRCDACSRLLAEALAAMHGETQEERSVPCSVGVFAPGTVVAQRFEIVRLVGRGGMGEVYEALDSTTHDRVALKTIAASRSDLPDAVECLCCEARLSRGIRHPNVCHVLDAGIQRAAPDQEHSYYLTMPFVRGPTLGRWIRERGPLALADALALGRDMLLGLSAVHEAGVVHLDFKSDNVMLAQEAERTRAIIIDFGLARRLDATHTLTGSDSLSGTISYMAPEQLLGLPRGRFTDVFAFGVVLFEALTGEHPLLCRPASLGSAVARLTQLPLRLSRSLSGIPASVDEFVAQCTQSQPEERYPDAASALVALSECCDDCATGAHAL